MRQSRGRKLPSNSKQYLHIVSKRFILTFGALLLNQETPVGFQQAADLQCILSVIQPCFFFMGLELPNYLRIHTEYSHFLFYLSPLQQLVLKYSEKSMATRNNVLDGTVMTKKVLELVAWLWSCLHPGVTQSLYPTICFFQSSPNLLMKGQGSTI